MSPAVPSPRPGTHVRLVRPAPEHLASYADALARGWSPDTQRPAAARETLARLRADPEAFLARQEDRDGAGPPVVLPDGSAVPRLPSVTRWLWDGAFAGQVAVRWAPGTPALPPTCLGHVGYAVVPWRRRRGYATRALGLLLDELGDELRGRGLPWVEVTTDPENVASQRVILANGGALVGRFTKPAAHGGGAGLRYRIALDTRATPR
jgi:predicted acetyltransferase